MGLRGPHSMARLRRHNPHRNPMSVPAKLLGVPRFVHRKTYRCAILFKQLQAAQPSTPKINQADLMALTLTRYALSTAPSARHVRKKTKSTVAAAPKSIVEPVHSQNGVHFVLSWAIPTRKNHHDPIHLLRRGSVVPKDNSREIPPPFLSRQDFVSRRQRAVQTAFFIGTIWPRQASCS